ncbi:PQ-loop repeat [Trinorchestia longiramus]|nr:PQ-loop repeat [Trinorchestia longiramus]
MSSDCMNNTSVTQDEFRLRHPNEVLHVRLNDVIFPLYAVLCTAVQIIQCFFYPKAEGQKVSWPCRIISAILLLIVLLSCILVPILDDFLWIDVLYLMSYVKLFISMIKYAPQLFTNFKAKSTAGWSIFQVMLDFTGGVMSIIQMFLIADNYDDINSVLSDPTKLGLGLLSIFFNILFFIQHFVLYRNNDNNPQDFSITDKPYQENHVEIVLTPNAVYTPFTPTPPSYIPEGRSAKCSYNHYISSSRPVLAGVLQGSVIPQHSSTYLSPTTLPLDLSSPHTLTTSQHKPQQSKSLTPPPSSPPTPLTSPHGPNKKPHSINSQIPILPLHPRHPPILHQSSCHLGWDRPDTLSVP